MSNETTMNSESFSLSEREMRIIREEDERRGIKNLSATARLIINEWWNLKHPPTDDNGKDIEHE